MMEFETAFDLFLGKREYDRVENALFLMARAAFAAGWTAAGGAAPPDPKIIEFLPELRREIGTGRTQNTEG
ncbi:MAG TPA: hypothetical protein H9671_01815 [Firmicutes bacterium]|nr:hypothetical protein [Bacillota bacterium]